MVSKTGWSVPLQVRHTSSPAVATRMHRRPVLLMQEISSFLADLLQRFGDNLVDRITGPMTFRLLMQPLMATILAVRAGIRDAETGVPPYLWSLVRHPEHRRALLRDGWKDVGRVFALAILIDCIYQIVVLRWVYPLETLVVATVLAFIPYVLIRGPVTRLRSSGKRVAECTPGSDPAINKS